MPCTTSGAPLLSTHQLLPPAAPPSASVSTIVLMRFSTLLKWKRCMICTAGGQAGDREGAVRCERARNGC